MAHDVFISYATEDKITADAVCAWIEGHGVSCWIAPRDIRPGVVYGEAIIDAITSCRAMVVILSTRSNASSFVHGEVERATTKGIPVIPFVIEKVNLSKSMEFFISQRQWLDAVSPPLEDHLSRLLEVIQTLLKTGTGMEYAQGNIVLTHSVSDFTKSTPHQQTEPLPGNGPSNPFPRVVLMITVAIISFVAIIFLWWIYESQKPANDLGKNSFGTFLSDLLPGSAAPSENSMLHAPIPTSQAHGSVKKFEPSEEDIAYASFIGPDISSSQNMNISPGTGFSYNTSFGNSWRIFTRGGGFTGTFTVPSSGWYNLVVKHESSPDNMHHQKGYSPITIQVNSEKILSDYDPATYHPEINMPMDTCTFFTHLGKNTLQWTSGTLSTHYWIRSIEVQSAFNPKSPVPQNAPPPVISSVTPILPLAKQRIVILGSGFGSSPSKLYIHGDSVDIGEGNGTGPSLFIRDHGGGKHNWIAGQIINKYKSSIGLKLESWSDSQIVLEGFGSDLSGRWKIAPGDPIDIVVFGPGNSGSTIYTINVVPQLIPEKIVTQIPRNGKSGNPPPPQTERDQSKNVKNPLPSIVDNKVSTAGSPAPVKNTPGVSPVTTKATSVQATPTPVKKDTNKSETQSPSQNKNKGQNQKNPPQS